MTFKMRPQLLFVVFITFDVTMDTCVMHRQHITRSIFASLQTTNEGMFTKASQLIELLTVLECKCFLDTQDNFVNYM